MALTPALDLKTLFEVISAGAIFLGGVGRVGREVGRWGGGVKIWLACSHHCVSIRTQFPFHFFLLYGPLTNRGVPGTLSGFPRSARLWSPTGEDLAIFRPVGLAEKLRFWVDP